MKSSIANSRQRTFFKHLAHWFREYQLFLATVGVLIGAHFVGEALKAFADIICDLTKVYCREGLGTAYMSLVTTEWQIWDGTAIIDAAIGFGLCWLMVCALKRDPSFAHKRNPRAPAGARDQRTWVERLSDFPTKTELRIVVFSILFLVLLELAIHSIELLVHRDVGWHLLWVPAFLLVAIGLAPAAHAVTFVNIELEEPSDEQRKFLIMFLSNNDEPAPAVSGNSLLQYTNVQDDCQALATHFDRKRERWNWEPCLRGIEKHAKVLERLYIVASTESVNRIGAFCRHIAAYQNSGVLCKAQLQVFAVNHLSETPTRIDLATPDDPAEPSITGIDFEDYKQIALAVKSAVHHAADEAQTVIDITGGQKPNSLVGGIMTLDKNKLIVQYVQTGGSKKPKFYRIVKKPTLGV